MKVLDPQSVVASPLRMKIYLLSGVVGVGIATVYIGVGIESLILFFGPPVIVAIHFSYLARAYLWQRS